MLIEDAILECLLDSGQVQRAEDAGMKDPLATLALNPPAEQVSWSLGLPSPRERSRHRGHGLHFIASSNFLEADCPCIKMPSLGYSPVREE